MLKRKNLLLLSLFCFLIGGAVFAQEDLGPIRERMLKRLPKIGVLKSQGLIGEDNTGYLQAVDVTLEPPQEELITQENKDRKLIYAVIASKQGTTPELVGRRRAIRIRERAKAGEFVMDEEGNWERKKQSP